MLYHDSEIYKTERLKESEGEDCRRNQLPCLDGYVASRLLVGTGGKGACSDTL